MSKVLDREMMVISFLNTNDGKNARAKIIALKFLTGHVEGHTKLSVGIRPF